MRIHTDTLTHQDVVEAVRAAGVVTETTFWGTEIRSVRLNDAGVRHHGSRKRDHAFEVGLLGTSSRSTNSGVYGAGAGKAATWDEWGMFLGALYEKDPLMFAGRYQHAAYFHWATGGRFRDLTPAGQHKNHRWVYSGEVLTASYRVRECKCGALRRHLTHGVEFSDINWEA